MTKLIFKAADLKRVVEHSLGAPKQARVLIDYNDSGPVYGQPEAPAVLLVHDDGVYIMSNGEPRDIAEPDATGSKNERANEGRSYVAYAEGCNPNSDSDFYETSRQLVGGDDFGETLPWAIEIGQLIQAGHNEIIIDVTGGRLELLTETIKH